MMYLSRGILQEAERSGEARVSLHGTVYVMGPRLAALWAHASKGPQAVPRGSEREITRMAESGLAVTTEASGNLAAYRLLSQCILCPESAPHGRLPLFKRERRLWSWLSQAGLRLTACELIRLEELGLKPTQALLGETHRQELTEAIYSPETISDGVLETVMEHSAARNATVASLIQLLRAQNLFLA